MLSFLVLLATGVLGINAVGCTDFWYYNASDASVFCDNQTHCGDLCMGYEWCIWDNVTKDCHPNLPNYGDCDEIGSQCDIITASLKLDSPSFEQVIDVWDDDTVTYQGLCYMQSVNPEYVVVNTYIGGSDPIKHCQVDFFGFDCDSDECIEIAQKCDENCDNCARLVDGNGNEVTDCATHPSGCVMNFTSGATLQCSNTGTQCHDNEDNDGDVDYDEYDNFCYSDWNVHYLPSTYHSGVLIDYTLYDPLDDSEDQVNCDDGLDNDGDGYCDMPDSRYYGYDNNSDGDCFDSGETAGGGLFGWDRGCFDKNDNNEVGCSDGIDGDGDGIADDAGCYNATADIEEGCHDGYDNDGDGYCDYEGSEYAGKDTNGDGDCHDAGEIGFTLNGVAVYDPGCSNTTDDYEEDTICSDGLDNDGDGYCDAAGLLFAGFDVNGDGACNESGEFGPNVTSYDFGCEDRADNDEYLHAPLSLVPNNYGFTDSIGNGLTYEFAAPLASIKNRNLEFQLTPLFNSIDYQTRHSKLGKGWDLNIPYIYKIKTSITYDSGTPENYADDYSEDYSTFYLVNNNQKTQIIEANSTYYLRWDPLVKLEPSTFNNAPLHDPLSWQMTDTSGIVYSFGEKTIHNNVPAFDLETYNWSYMPEKYKVEKQDEGIVSIQNDFTQWYVSTITNVHGNDLSFTYWNPGGNNHEDPTKMHANGNWTKVVYLKNITESALNRYIELEYSNNTNMPDEVLLNQDNSVNISYLQKLDSVILKNDAGDMIEGYILEYENFTTSYGEDINILKRVKQKGLQGGELLLHEFSYSDGGIETAESTKRGKWSISYTNPNIDLGNRRVIDEVTTDSGLGDTFATGYSCTNLITLNDTYVYNETHAADFTEAYLCVDTTMLIDSGSKGKIEITRSSDIATIGVPANSKMYDSSNNLIKETTNSYNYLANDGTSYYDNIYYNIYQNQTTLVRTETGNSAQMTTQTTAIDSKGFVTQTKTQADSMLPPSPYAPAAAHPSNTYIVRDYVFDHKDAKNILGNINESKTSWMIEGVVEYPAAHSSFEYNADGLMTSSYIYAYDDPNADYGVKSLETEFTYDIYGNLKEMIDENFNVETYDYAFPSAYLISKKNAHDLETINLGVDEALARLANSSTPTQFTVYDYDEFGRTDNIQTFSKNQTYLISHAEYEFNWSSFPIWKKTTTWIDDSAGQKKVEKTFFDKFGRVVRTHSYLDSSNCIVNAVDYNDFGLMAEAYPARVIAQDCDSISVTSSNIYDGFDQGITYDYTDDPLLRQDRVWDPDDILMKDYDYGIDSNSLVYVDELNTDDDGRRVSFDILGRIREEDLIPNDAQNLLATTEYIYDNMIERDSSEWDINDTGWDPSYWVFKKNNLNPETMEGFGFDMADNLIEYRILNTTQFLVNDNADIHERTTSDGTEFEDALKQSVEITVTGYDDAQNFNLIWSETIHADKLVPELEGIDPLDPEATIIQSYVHESGLQEIEYNAINQPTLITDSRHFYIPTGFDQGNFENVFDRTLYNLLKPLIVSPDRLSFGPTFERAMEYDSNEQLKKVTTKNPRDLNQERSVAEFQYDDAGRISQSKSTFTVYKEEFNLKIADILDSTVLSNSKTTASSVTKDYNEYNLLGESINLTTVYTDFYFEGYQEWGEWKTKKDEKYRVESILRKYDGLGRLTGSQTNVNNTLTRIESMSISQPAGTLAPGYPVQGIDITDEQFEYYPDGLLKEHIFNSSRPALIIGEDSGGNPIVLPDYREKIVDSYQYDKLGRQTRFNQLKYKVDNMSQDILVINSTETKTYTPGGKSDRTTTLVNGMQTYIDVDYNPFGKILLIQNAGAIPILPGNLTTPGNFQYFYYDLDMASSGLDKGGRLHKIVGPDLKVYLELGVSGDGGINLLTADGYSATQDEGFLDSQQADSVEINGNEVGRLEEDSTSRMYSTLQGNNIDDRDSYDPINARTFGKGRKIGPAGIDYPERKVTTPDTGSVSVSDRRN